MHGLEENSENVPYLINKLCFNILNERNDLSSEQIQAAVPKLRALSYEILLKKSPRTQNDAGAGENNEFDPLRALEVQMFAAKLNSKTTCQQISGNFNEFEKELEEIINEPYFIEGPGKNMLQFLLALQENDIHNEYEVPKMCPPTLLVPGPFTLHANYKANPHYPEFDDCDIMNPTPKYFKSITALKSSDNPYLPRFLFDGEKNQLLEIEKKYKSSNAKQVQCTDDNEFTFTGMTKRLLDGDADDGASKMHINMDSLRLFPKTNFFKFPCSTVVTSFKAANKNVVKSLPKESEEKKVFSWAWENLGCFGLTCSKPFVGESNATLLLKAHVDVAERKQFQANMLKQADFMMDLKSLTVGIQSETFYHNDLIIFSMKPNVSVENILPGTIEQFVGDFLECGTCYKRLQTMIMKKDYKLMFEGFVFKALCTAIDEYLLTFRQYVFAKKDTNLLGFYKRMKIMIRQITNLSYTLAIHPNVDNSVNPPMGSQFLGYLYREIMRLTEKDYITLLVFILKRCCHVYFKHLQKWIYYGLLDDPCNELFIGFVDHYRQNTKYFYDKAYFIRRESVPGFFQNYEDEILQCGKYTMLLKAYKPNHPIFDLEYPSISVCLSFEEIKKLESLCQTQQNAVFAQPVTIRQIFETRAEEKKKFFRKMQERSRANLERWTDEQHELALVVAEQKKKRLEALSLQLEDVKQRKISERKANVELELRYLREAEKLEEKRTILDNINLKKRIEYYQELSDMIQEREKERERERELKLKLNIQIPQLQDEQQQLIETPLTAGTNFESCFGDDDVDEHDEDSNSKELQVHNPDDDDDDDDISEYEECLSEEFIEKFEENENELNAFIKENKKEINANLISALPEEAANLCDLLNSNNNNEALQINKLKAMSGSNVALCFQNDEQQAPTLQVDLQQNSSNTKELKDATNLKMSEILSEKFHALHQEEHSKSMPDINLNIPADSELTDLQRNRNRMMQNDIFSEINKDPATARSQLYLNLDTDRARNRLKVLESEYNIITGKTQSDYYTGFGNNKISKTDRQRNRLGVLENEYNIITGRTQTENYKEISNNKAAAAANIIAQGRSPISPTTPATPMSTTSDTTPVTESLPSVIEQKNTIENNGNGNNLDGKPMPSLKLNVVLAREDNKAKHYAIPTAAIFGETTPEYALNTCGIMSKQGFPFPGNKDQENLHKKQQQHDATSEPPIKNESIIEEDACPQPDLNNPYKRCCELIETNFKCKTASPYIRLNDCNHKNKIQSTEAAIKTKLDINSISVITLTDFLQKSVILPMSMHLELVNNEVMRMFLKDLKIIDHFRSLRNYYFMMDGEFGSIICDGIISKLELDEASPQKLLNYQMLHSILDTALGSSITGNDKNAENLSFIVNDVPEKFDLNSPDVLNNLSLSYMVKWPLNLVLNPETLEQYANIFKYLIRVRRISWILERAYQILKETIKRNGSDILKSPQYRHVQLMRHKFYHFVHALQNHITSSALQASWKTFKDELMTANTIEDIYRKHTTYIKRILFLCMLNKRSAEFYNTIENIFRISLRFYGNLKSRDFKLKPGNQHYTHSRYEKLVNDELEFDKFIKYTIYLGNKIVRHGYQSEIGEFINLINFNQCYMQNV